MAANVILVLATILVAYLLGHWFATRKARRDRSPAPGFFDYKAHRALWAPSQNAQLDRSRFWILVVIGVVIAVTLTDQMSFGVGFAIATAVGFAVGGVYRWTITRRVNRQP